MEQDNIYRDAKLPHCQRKEAFQNMNRQNRETWLLELFERDFVMEAPEVSQVPFGTAVDCTLCFFFLKEIKKKERKKNHSNTSPYNAYHHRCAFHSVFETHLYLLKIISSPSPEQIVCIAKCYSIYVHTHQEKRFNLQIYREVYYLSTGCCFF